MRLPGETENLRVLAARSAEAMTAKSAGEHGGGGGGDGGGALILDVPCVAEMDKLRAAGRRQMDIFSSEMAPFQRLGLEFVNTPEGARASAQLACMQSPPRDACSRTNLTSMRARAHTHSIVVPEVYTDRSPEPDAPVHAGSSRL